MTTESTSLPVPIERLLIAHVAVTILLLVCAIFGLTFPALRHVAFVITSSQFTLLSIWVAFGEGLAARRYLIALVAALLIVLVRSLVTLASISALTPLAPLESTVLLAMEIGFNRLGRLLLVCVVLIALRRTTFHMAWVDEKSTVPGERRFQFAMWQLLVIVFAAALAVTAGKQVYAFFEEHSATIGSDWMLYVLHQLYFLLVGMTYSLSIVLLGLWCTLGCDRLWLPVAGALLCASLVSPIWPLLSHQPREGFAVQSLVTFFQTLLVIVSLLAVRWSGFRLQRGGQPADVVAAPPK